MTRTAFLVPKRGKTVRDPHTQEPLLAKGETKEVGAYWQRRINEGDVRETEPPADVPPAAAVADTDIKPAAKPAAAKSAATTKTKERTP